MTADTERSGPTPLVSIIIPCYNAEAYVGEAIESALAQTYPNVEVIVVDDGSTDGSLGVIRRFESRVRWETGPNRGGGAARNRGLALARGDLVQFLDADDLLFPRKLARCVEALDTQRRELTPVCDWETIGMQSGGEAARVSSLKRIVMPWSSLRSQLPTPSPLHWRSRLEAVGDSTQSLPCSQERDLHLRLACAGARFVHVPEVLYRVRRRAGSVSDSYERVLAQHGRIFRRAMELLENHNAMTQRRRRAFAAAFARDARHCAARGLWALAEEYFATARGLDRRGAASVFANPLGRIIAAAAGPAVADRVAGWGRRWGGKNA